MKTLVIYDSFFGNTERIAAAIGEALGAPDEVTISKVDALPPNALDGLTLLVVGSPTRGFSPSPAIKTFLNGIPNGALRGVKVAAFDTRLSITDNQPAILKLLAGIFGFAAEPMARKLVGKGGVLALPAEGFIVKDSEGPLKDGELERAASWGRQIAQNL